MSTPAVRSSKPSPAPEPTRTSAARAPKAPSVIGAELTLEGDVSGGGELQIDGTIKGDVRIEHVTVGDGGSVEGGIYAEAVEVRGKVSGSITASPSAVLTQIRPASSSRRASTLLLGRPCAVPIRRKRGGY